MKYLNKLFIFIFVLLIPFALRCDYLRVKCKSGDGITILLNKYNLPANNYYINEFKAINKGKIKKNGDLLIGTNYNMPIKKFTYNGKNIRSSLEISSFEDAKEIQNFNEKLYKDKVITKPYTKSNLLLVPSEYSKLISVPLNEPSSKGNPSKEIEEKVPFNTRLFGKDYQNINIKDNSLQGRVYYISSGHGGCDPGAIGTKDGKTLCEDEYAYDVSLRITKGLLEHGATVYMIVQDPDDGIRDANYLECDNDEYFYGNDSISTSQATRLNKRADIMNKLYDKHKKNAKSQTALIIHVDSRYQDKRIDIFYYHRQDDTEGKEIAKTLYKTIKDKYEANQPGRGYYGTISSRDLLEMRRTRANTVYIELGNIQNPSDQIRFIDPNNRQAIANWIVLGLMKHSKK